VAHDHLADYLGDLDSARMRRAMSARQKGMHMQGEAMKQRDQDRRQSQSVFYDAINDRRTHERRDQDPVPAIPGMIRPGPGEALPQLERRRFPDAGME
jgi:hypothetical protein